MITSLEFENFRLFTKLKISPCKRINLIAGANNTGKTCILEGLYLLLAHGSNQIAKLPAVFRNPTGLPADDYATFWQPLFYDRQTDLTPGITAGRESEQRLECLVQTTADQKTLFYYQISKNADRQRSLRDTVRQAGHYAHAFEISANGQGVASGLPNPCAKQFIVLATRTTNPGEDADLYNEVTLLGGGEEKLLALLRSVDPRLEKLRYAKAPGTSQPLVYAHFGLKNALSMNQTGQGFNKLFSLFCQMLASQAQVVLIDEIENGLYYETLPEIWKGIAALASSQNLQVFATTHSHECIVAAHETLKATPEYNFAFHRLQRVKGQLEAVTHDREMLEAALHSGLEVR